MFEVLQHPEFVEWLHRLRDIQAKARILRRLNRLERGLVGDAKFIEAGVRELRIDYGPGYRLYFIQRGRQLIVMLCGGDKASQRADIAQALRIAREVEHG
jgi:putative addiction module killer protein